MGDGLLMLSWKNHGSTFSHVISSLREKGHYTDVTLACDGRFYPAHKIVLSACSQYFEEMLQNTPCKHPIIVLKDISPKELDALLNYMYAGEVSVSQHNLTPLIKAAESLHIKGLAVPDELPTSGNLKENKSLYVSSDNRVSPPAKRQRRERDISPPRDSHTPLNRSPDPSPPLDNENIRAPSFESRNRLPSFENENTLQIESAHSTVKTEAPSLPSSPSLQENEVAEQSTSSSGLPQDAHVSPRTSEARNQSSTNFQNQDSFEPLFEVKEEVLDCDAEGPVQEVSFTPPAATGGATASSTTSGAAGVSAVVSTASGVTLAAASGATNPRPHSGGNNFEDHIRSLLFKSPERRDSLHSESSGFHGPGPSGLLGNISVNVREGYRPGTENYNTKPPEGFPTLPSQHGTVPTHVPSVGPTHISSGGPTHAHPEVDEMKGRLRPRSQLHGSIYKSELGHMLTATGKKLRKMHNCLECGYGTPNHTVFLAHCRTHTGERPYFCTFCAFRCAQYGTLWNHLRTHSKDNIFACQHCPFRCDHKRSLKRHLKQHFPDLCQ